MQNCREGDQPDLLASLLVNCSQPLRDGHILRSHLDDCLLNHRCNLGLALLQTITAKAKVLSQLFPRQSDGDGRQVLALQYVLQTRQPLRFL